jgi:transcriptional regulator with PAS, ATPase and Fis domain
MKEIIEFGEQVADSKSTVLLTGESGTGKEIFAHAIHNHSQRKNKNFVVLNCAAIPRSLIESELFGYEEGSFTGAKRGGHPGKFEIADGGTIFLDEIGEMPLDMQTKLLRVIQEGVVSRVGSSSQFPVDVRIIAATNKDLYEEVTKGNFRLDLYYRLKVLPIYLPALRHRSEDIPLMTTYFINKISKRLNKAPIKIPADYMEKLMRYNWPGNVRELENIVELMLNTRKLPELETTDQILPERYHMDTELSPEITKLDDFEKCHIENILKLNDYNLSSAAKMLGIGRNTLYRKIEKYQLHCSN